MEGPVIEEFNVAPAVRLRKSKIGEFICLDHNRNIYVFKIKVKGGVGPTFSMSSCITVKF